MEGERRGSSKRGRRRKEKGGGRRRKVKWKEEERAAVTGCRSRLRYLEIRIRYLFPDNAIHLLYIQHTYIYTYIDRYI